MENPGERLQAERERDGAGAHERRSNDGKNE
jgi:hypothetical protein